MTWHPDSSRLDLLAYNMLNNQQTSSPCCCLSPEIHIYADIGHWRRKNQASVWIWCSHCGAYDHLDGMIISEKWVNCADIGVAIAIWSPGFNNRLWLSASRIYTCLRGQLHTVVQSGL